MTDFYLPIIMMSIIISVMLFTFLCSLSVSRSKAKSSTVPVQYPKIKYNIPQTPVTTKETHINMHDIMEQIQKNNDALNRLEDKVKARTTMKYYSEDTINELK